MSRKRRSIVFYIFCGIGMLLLGGCSGRPDDKNRIQLVEEEAAKQEKVLSFFAPMEPVSNDSLYYREQIDQYNTQNSGIRVVYDGISTADGFNGYLEQRLDAGQGDDVFIVNADMVKPLYHKGYFYDLSELTVFERLNEQAKEQTMIGDIAYCLPVGMTAYCLFVNQDVLDQYGLQAPEDLDEFRTCCRTVKEAGGKPISINRGYAMTVPAMANGLYRIYGARNPQEVRDGLNSGEIQIGDYMLEGFQVVEEFVQEQWYGDGLDTATVDTIKAGTQDVSDFANGDTAFYFGHLNMISVFEEINPELNFVVQGVPIPGGSVTLPAVLTRLCVNADSENLEDSLAFVEYITSRKHDQIVKEGNELLPVYQDADFTLNSERMRPAYETYLSGGQIPIEDMQLQFTYWDTIRELSIAMFDGSTAEEAAAAYNKRQMEQIALYQN